MMEENTHHSAEMSISMAFELREKADYEDYEDYEVISVKL